MSFTGYVTVRLNSKRLPKKSVKKLGGSPLVNTAISKLSDISDISKTLLYCSDEGVTDYIDDGLDYEFVKRDVKYDGDYVTFNDILDSIIDDIDTEYVVFLSVTSPFIKTETIVDMIEQIKSNGYDSAFLAYELNGFCWYDGNPLNYEMSMDSSLGVVEPVRRTQDLQPVVVENSGLYIFKTETYRKYKRRIGFNPYIKKAGIVESWDIDTEEEFNIAQILEKQND